ncbi:hypothetical protein ANCCAN_28564 [Ancylostoma caninum]|uniref:Uncharacterized protein n=1 Tax=Ancylostoma caninum TaxID=29170 RepID=A0A368F0W9_ANCCA|nr:hypothetical protein ANCCAN_28564 [Ancylostoma caninum]
MYRLLIRQLKEIVQITDEPDVEFLKGADMAKIKSVSSPIDESQGDWSVDWFVCSRGEANLLTRLTY